MTEFPCYSCSARSGSTGHGRCSNFMSCKKWLDWAREQNLLNDEGDVDDV